MNSNLMFRGNATGAGVNRRKYSGKELITFGGYDAMDYHARWRPTVVPLFTTPDPLGEDFTNTSLYTYCGGDPVNNVDPSGMKIEPNSIEQFNRLRTEIESKRNELLNTISEIQDLGADCSKLIQALNTRVNGINSVLTNLYRLENSSQMYRLNYSVESSGYLSYDGLTGTIVINYTSIANFVHESIHAGQFESGDLGFVAKSGGTLAQDIYDEVEAYQSQFLFNPKSVIQLNLESLIESAVEITSSWVQSLKNSNGVAIYAPGNKNHVGIVPVNSQTCIRDLIKAYPNLKRIDSGLPPNIKLINISGFIFKK